ncbi:HD-domain/PDEase-like protein [Backusella circina FSU 941]|nr:HD-domain/PDEase-like protein [Backusella circina FSU 941]
MLILRHNTLSSEDLFTIECKMIKVADPSFKVKKLSEFTVLEKSRAELYGYILGFLERLGLCQSIGVTPSEFLDFLIDVDQGYLPNAYHSFFHAVDVAIVLYHMLCHFDVANYLSRIDMAALLIAGLCHDIGHPGKNNNFQVNLKTDLAVRYSNKSVLESYSCTVTMDLLTKHKLLRRISHASKAVGLPTTEPEFRTAIIKMILATDMIFHYELQENLANLLEIINDNGTIHKPVLPSTTEEENEEEMDEEDDYESDTNTENEDMDVVGEDNNDSGNNNNRNCMDDGNHGHGGCNDVQVKDIFSSQGAKSAISYFRKKSYFEEDMIPLALKTMPLLPASPEEEEEEEEENDENEEGGNQWNKESNDALQGREVGEEEKSSINNLPHHSSGADLLTTTISVDGHEKVIHRPPKYIMEPQQRLILCQIVLHAADISNALRPWPICHSWSNLVCEEFFRQGEAERAHGLPVSPNMDRSQVSQTTIGLQFGDFVVSPYFEIFAALFPKADEFLNELASNRTQWIKMEEEIEAQKNKMLHPQDAVLSEDEGNQRLPSNMLPDRPILNPSGRRVSVAAGMVIIPDELEERTIGSGRNQRKYWGVRSVSHSDISQMDKIQRQRAEVAHRRKSEEPSFRRLKGTPMSPRKSSRASHVVNQD